MKIFINAKTRELCENIASALEEFSAELTLCSSDDEQNTDYSEYDTIIVSTPLRSDFGLNYTTDVASKTTAPIIVLVRADISGDVQQRLKFTGAFVLAKPFSKSALTQTIKTALVAKENINRLEQEKSSLSQQLKDTKIIDRAKCCLIEYLGLSENKAHRHIQKLAMDTRRSQREVAEDILRTYAAAPYPNDIYQ